MTPSIPGESSSSADLSPALPGERTNFLQPPPDQTNRAQYCLVFLNEVGDRIYANNLVKAKNRDHIKVAIHDTYTQSVISPDCSLSSAKVKLMVLDADFWENKGETWSWSEFNQSVLSGRTGKRPILICPSLPIKLENGVGTFKNIVFNDNSSWLNRKLIRLGVKVDGEEGYLNGERVQEGVSKPFRVMDRKSKESKKSKQLKLIHGVKRIKKVGNYRASLLEKENIKTVEDLLKLYYDDESALCRILGINSESDRGWMSIVEHATQCADEYRAKFNASNNSSHPQQALVHPMERNMPPSTEPNPSESNIMEAVMPARNRQRFPMCDNGHTRNNVPFEPLSSENGDSTQPNNGGFVVDLGSSEPNPSENNRIEGQHDPSSNDLNWWNNLLQSEPLLSDGGGFSQHDLLDYLAR